VDQIEADLDPSCDVPIYDCAVDPEQALCKYRDKIDVYEMEANLAVGPIFARHIGNRMYRGEYYALQVDAHVTFVTGWDVSLIEQHIATNNEMAVLTTYLTDVEGSIDPDTGNSLRTTRPIMVSDINCIDMLLLSCWFVFFHCENSFFQFTLFFSAILIMRGMDIKDDFVTFHSPKHNHS